ncbi:MAG TPA: sigma-70 family RNA polymerase sigma factor [Ktedonobacterales bacterium]|nr:sigma-70 family RNA polymerase sigma factor [Ktedonobacterales bacterium]
MAGVSDGEPARAELGALIVRFSPPLYAFLRGLVADPEHARDLLQDVFCDAWRAILRAALPFSPGPATNVDADATQRSWLFHVAYCRAVSARRRARLLRWRSLDADDAAASDPAILLVAPPFDDQLAEDHAVRAALASLTRDDAACLLLNVVHGFSAAEIARICDVSPAAAKKRLSRAKQRLRAAYLAQNPDAAARLARYQQEEPSAHVHE